MLLEQWPQLCITSTVKGKIEEEEEEEEEEE